MSGMFFLILPWLFLQNIDAGEKPKWTSQTPPETKEEVYVVGRSPLLKSEAEGLRSAGKDAKEQILRQVFGTSIRVETTQVETLTDVGMASKLSETSDEVTLEGFKQLEVYSEKEQGGVLVFALFSVPRAALKSEKIKILAARALRQKKHLPPRELIDSKSNVVEAPGEKKLRKGMKKSQVIAMFGTPQSADSDSFTYRNPEFCEEWCAVWFNGGGKSDHWHRFRPGFTTDLDDDP